MDENEKNDVSPLVEYRLSQIEKTLAEMKTILEKARDSDQTMVRDISDAEKKQAEIISAFNAHEKRITALEQAPLKAKADRWQQIVDLVFKISITAAVVSTFAKIGLQAGA